MWRSTRPDRCLRPQPSDERRGRRAARDLAVGFDLLLGAGRARRGCGSTAYLVLTMLPLALAGPLIAPILDRAGPATHRSRSPRPPRGACSRSCWRRAWRPTGCSRWRWRSSCCSKVHAIAKNALTMAYASRADGLMRANARLGRVGLAGAIAVVPLGILALKAVDPAAPLYLAAVIYAGSALLTARLPHPGAREQVVRAPGDPDRAPMGRVRRLQLPAMGAVGMRAAAGFLLFLLAFALRDAEVPALWFAVVGGAGIARRVRRRCRRAGAAHRSAGGGGGDRVLSVGGDRRAARLAALRPPVADDLRVLGGRRRPSSPAWLSRPDAATRATRGAGPRLRPLRGALPAGLGAGRVRAGPASDLVPPGRIVLALFYTAARRRVRRAGPRRLNGSTAD